MHGSDLIVLDLPDAISLAMATAHAEPMVELLSAEDRAHLATLQRADRHARFLLGRATLRQMLARRMGMDPAEVPLRVGEGGRLVVGDHVHVSLSHAGRGMDAAAAAAVHDEPIGLDIERINPRHPDLWRRVLRPDEYGEMEALGGPTDASQTLLWVLKEAVLKGQGTGLRASMQSVRLNVAAKVAESDQSGTWQLRFDRVGDLWVAVAFQ